MLLLNFPITKVSSVICWISESQNLISLFFSGSLIFIFILILILCFIIIILIIINNNTFKGV
jgi:hypothetical protein